MKGGALHELPGGWVWTRLGEIIAFEYGKGLTADKREQKGDIPVYGSNGIVGYHSIPLIEKPCIIIGRKGAAGYVHLSNVPCWPIDTTYSIIPPDELNLVFLYYLLSILNLNSLDKSTAIPGLNRNDAYALKIPLPPLPEQRAIVSKIEQLFSDLENGIENFKKAQTQLKLYRQSVLKAACEGKLVPTEAELARAEGRDYEAADVLLARVLKERRAAWEKKGAKYKEPETPDTKSLLELPEGWRWSRFEQIVSLSQNGFGKRSSNEGNPTIVLRLADIINGKISLNNVRRIRATSSEIEKYKLLNNDILCIRVNGSRNLVGRMIRYKPVPEPITFCDHFIRFQFVDPAMAPLFSMYFETEMVRKYVDINMVSTAGQNTVSQVTIMAIPIPLPPLAEQRRIVAEVERRLSVCDKMEATITESLQKAESLRQSILKKAFEGKLLNKKELEEARNVSDWEPAEKLLERIRQEKAQTGEKKRK
jgi:type I restriction enzyme S subunit